MLIKSVLKRRRTQKIEENINSDNHNYKIHDNYPNFID